MPGDIFLRFADLRARGIVANWPSLQNRIRKNGFPPGRLIGPNARAWSETEVAEWIASRPVERKSTPRRHRDRELETT
jgi:hypothetical protein